MPGGTSEVDGGRMLWVNVYMVLNPKPEENLGAEMPAKSGKRQLSMWQSA